MRTPSSCDTHTHVYGDAFYSRVMLRDCECGPHILVKTNMINSQNSQSGKRMFLNYINFMHRCTQKMVTNLMHQMINAKPSSMVCTMYLVALLRAISCITVHSWKGMCILQNTKVLNIPILQKVHPILFS